MTAKEWTEYLDSALKGPDGVMVVEVKALLADFEESERSNRINLEALATVARDYERASREVEELREELEALKPFAIGGDGSTHWYWKDEAERLEKELKQLAEEYGLAYEDRKGRE